MIRVLEIPLKIRNVHLQNRVEVGHNNLGVCDTSAITYTFFGTN